MGTICILLGVILLFGFVGLGFFASNAVIGNELYMSLFGVSNMDVSIIYVIIVGVCFFIGLLICLNLVMHGLNSNKLSKLIAMYKTRK